MTWSVTKIGKAAAVKTAVADELGKIGCDGPEAKIKSHISSAISVALDALPPGSVVKVTASGSQWQPDATKEEFINSCTMTFETLYGFVE